MNRLLRELPVIWSSGCLEQAKLCDTGLRLLNVKVEAPFRIADQAQMVFRRLRNIFAKYYNLIRCFLRFWYIKYYKFE